jgi:hypothetical protein
VQGPVGVAVAATVQPMPAGLAAVGGDGGDPAQVGEGGLAAQPHVALIEVATDAGKRQTIKAHRNTGTPVTFPLAGAFHVRLTIQNLISASFRDVTAAFGDAKFACGK